MRKTIEVVYEEGVLKPLEPVELEEGERTKITIEKGILTLEDIKEIEGAIGTLPKISSRKLDEMYYEGKMLD